MSKPDRMLARLLVDLQSTQDRIARYERDAVNANTPTRQNNMISLLENARAEKRVIEGRIIDRQVQLGMNITEARKQQFEKELGMQRERCKFFEQLAVETQKELAEKGALNLLDAARNEICDIEARLSDLTQQLQLSPTEDCHQQQLQQLEVGLVAAKKKSEDYVLQAESASEKTTKDKYLRLKSNVGNWILNIDNCISDIYTRQTVMDAILLSDSQTASVHAAFSSQGVSVMLHSEEKLRLIPTKNSEFEDTTPTNLIADYVKDKSQQVSKMAEIESIIDAIPQKSLFESTKKIMISYCWRDKEIVHSVVQFLENIGFSVWIDETNTTLRFIDAITKAINESEAVVVFLSDDSVRSEYCNKEITYATDRNKTIIPI
ncbi:cytokinesis protein 3, partial [Physocladia obscura]